MELQTFGSLRKPQAQHTSHFEQPLSTTLVAGAINSHRSEYEAFSIIGTGYSPVLSLCRSLLATGVHPDAALISYRNGILSFRIRSIGEGARLVVKDDGNTGRPRFINDYSQTRAATSPIRENGRAAA
jgi:hypothetical protein